MSGGGRVTIRDAARASGVSSQTVSNVLHGRGRVANSTRARVIQVIESLGYRPHTGAVSMRTRRSGRIAHPIVPGELAPSNTIMLEFIRTLASAAGRHNHHLILAEGASDTEELVSSGSVNAVVLADVAPRDERVSTLINLGVPVACFGRIEPELSRNWIDIDSQASVRDLTTQLIAAGHTRLAFLGYATRSRWDIDREAGFRQAVVAAGLAEHVYTADLDLTAARGVIDTLLDHAAGPTAIVTGSDVLAAAVYAAAAHRKIRIGDNLAVTGFDGGLIGRLLTPTLTTLAIPLPYIAEWLVNRALSEIDGPTGDPGEMLLAELVIGQSASIGAPST